LGTLNLLVSLLTSLSVVADFVIINRT
jgi:hypothetical protein